MKSRIMYIENISGGLTGPARIGRVTFSKTGKTIYYQGRTFQSLKVVDSSGGGAEIDADVRLEYWRDSRGVPDRRANGIS